MKFLLAVYKILLSLRYKVKVKGIDVLKRDSPFLILPNHPAFVDPQILFSEIYRYTKVSPVVTDLYFQKPILKFIFRWLDSIHISHLEGDAHDMKVLEKTVKSVTKALKNKKSVLLYPAGRTAGQGYEAILGKQSTYHIVSSLPPGTKVIAVRIRGLWGSMWSRAWEGKPPDFFWTYGKAIFYVLANLIFFLPRRKVTLEFEDVTQIAQKNARKDLRDFNTFLENFYNKYGEEKALFLKHFFYVLKLKRKLPEHIRGSVAELQKTAKINAKEIDDSVFKFVRSKVTKIKDIPANKITLNSNLVLDLYFDSLGLAEIFSIIKAKFPSCASPPLLSLKTVADVCLMAQGKTLQEKELPVCTFNKDHINANNINIDLNKNIVQNFLDIFTSAPKTNFCYDEVGGSTTRKSFCTKTVIISRLIRKKNPQPHVGIMLPALQSTTLLIMSCYLAKKIPVMFNWTVGSLAMKHCMKSVKVKKIITVKKFFDRVKDQIPPELHKKFIFLEDEVRDLSLAIKIKGFFLSKIPKLAFYHKTYDKTAVILFTSGSEALPKAVALTHKNILADLWGTLKIFPAKNKEIMLGFLPPFHSFGFTLTSIFPLLTGMRIAYAPNPSDYHHILKILKHTKATILTSTPTFLKLIISHAEQEDFEYVKFVISGAEACHSSVFEAFAKLTKDKGKIIEGYGITECSPIITVNPLKKQKSESVGKAIEGVAIRVVDLETQISLAPKKEGMILVRGDNVFDGYLDKSLKNPFVKLEEKKYTPTRKESEITIMHRSLRTPNLSSNSVEASEHNTSGFLGEGVYYRTGDLGYLDKEGYLFITGRLKRFIKIAGEMISLPFIENLLLEKYGEEGENVLAVEGTDEVEPPKIVCFSTKEIDRGEVNEFLILKGVSNLIRIDEVRKIEEIPVLGTGKIDYKVLKLEV